MSRITTIPEGVRAEQLLFDAALKGMDFGFPYIPVTTDEKVGLKIEAESEQVTAPMRFPLALISRDLVQSTTPEEAITRDLLALFPDLEDSDISTEDADIIGIKWTQDNISRLFLPYILDVELESDDPKISKKKSRLHESAVEIVWLDYDTALAMLVDQFEAEHDHDSARYRPLKMMRKYLKHFTAETDEESAAASATL